MRIVWCSDFSHKDVATGFSRVSKEALKYLQSKGHEVVEVGVGYQGYGDALPWKVYPTTAYGGRLEGQDIAVDVAQNCEADALVLFMDVPDAAWAIQYHDRKGEQLHPNIIEALDKRSFALCLYTPIDGRCIDGRPPASWRGVFGGSTTFDAFAAPSMFGAEVLSDAVGKPVTHLPHGVDLSFFKPGNRKDARRMLNIPEDNLVILYVGVNKRRKQLPALFEAVAKFQAARPGVPVTLVVHGEERDEHYDLNGLNECYGIERNGGTFAHSRSFTDPGLRGLYQAADILGHLVGGEGFGVPVVEAGACRLPAIVTAYSSLPEIVPDNGWAQVPIRLLMPHPFNNIAWAWPDTDIAAERIAQYWDDIPGRIALRNAAFQKAQEYGWEKVLPPIETWIEAAVAQKSKFHSRIRVEHVEV